jgi:putative spermidine/putrescine transport system substrate-binding protein
MTSKAAALFVALALAAPAWAQAPALPSAPQTINVIDVAGNLALTQKAIEKYRADHAKTVGRITFTRFAGLA